MAVTISDYRLKGAVKRYNGAIIALREATSAGAFSTDAWIILPYNDVEGIDRKADSSDVKDGSNATIAASSTLTGYEISGKFLQVDKQTLDLLNSSTGKYYNVYFNNGSVNSKTQEWMAGICQLDGNFKINVKDWNEVPFKFVTLVNDAQLVVTCSLGTFATLKSQTFTIAAASHIVSVETT